MDIDHPSRAKGPPASHADDDAPGDLPDGRVSLYVGPECQDLGCGAITATTTLGAQTVAWRAIGFQTDCEDEVFPLDGVTAADVIFDRGIYDRVLRLELDRLRPLREGFEYPSQREQRARRKQDAADFDCSFATVRPPRSRVRYSA